MSFYERIKQGVRQRTDRYRNCDILKDQDTGDVLLETREIGKIPTTQYDTYHTVKPNEETRLDLIANQYYKTPLLWWVIAQANDIHDPMTAPTSGTILRIPPLSTLYGDGGILL